MLRSTLILLLVFPITVLASPAPSALPGAQLRGAATFKMLGLPLYEARLYTPGGGAFSWDQDFALELNYKRNLSQYDLVEATMRELKRTGTTLPVRDQLNTCFKAVSKGDQYLAVTNGDNRIGFWRNGAKVCTLKYAGIKRGFMSIFLGQNTRSKAFSRKLRGE